MPGSPATSTRAGAPRFANTDGINFSGQVNGVTDALDAAMALDSQGILSARPPANAANRGRYYWVAGDATANNNDRLWRCNGTTWTEIVMESREGKGLVMAYRAAALTAAPGGLVHLTAKEVDPEGWHNTGSGFYVPLIAGYYHFSWMISSTPPVGGVVQSWLAKNGACAVSGGR